MSKALQTQVKARTTPPFTAAPTRMLQRKCACGQHTIAGGQCDECRKKGQVLQRHPSIQSVPSTTQSAAHDEQGMPDHISAPHSMYSVESHFGHDFSQVQVHTDAQPKNTPCATCTSQVEKGRQSSSQVRSTSLNEIGEKLSNTSQQLDGRTRSHMENLFGVDFSGVRVHVNQEAQLAAEVLRADAFTVGAHVFFAHGKYDPTTTDGKSLIAHELTHVVQQNNGSVGLHDSDASDTTIGSLEREADTMAQHASATTNESFSATHYAKPARSSLTLATTPLGFLLKGSWRKEGQSFIDCVNDCTSSQGFAATLGGIIVGICGIVAVLAAAAAAPETAGTAAVPAGILAAAACAGLALGIPTGIMGRCMWECRG